MYIYARSLVERGIIGHEIFDPFGGCLVWVPMIIKREALAETSKRMHYFALIG
jgi:hypothetical protein